MTATPPWIYPEPWRVLEPPAIVLKLGDTRSPENLLAAARSLDVLNAKRYRGARCNIFTSDVTAILHAPIPHVADLDDGRGPRELQANDVVDGLRAGKIDGWQRIDEALELVNEGVPLVAWRASLGLPTIAVWKNPNPRRAADGRIITHRGRILYRSGHVALVVPTPPGAAGVYVTSAGPKCVQECPIAKAFGLHVPEVEFYGHE
jgi:hypothetical protein